MLRAVRRHPVSIAFCLLIVLAGVVFATLRGAHPSWLAISPESIAQGRWWTVLTALVVPDSLIELALTLVVATVALGYAERLIGPVRTALAFLAPGMLGMLVGVGVQALSTAQGAAWARVSGEVLDPAVGVVGAAMVASAHAPVLWRRRIRLIGFSTLIMFTLYSGDVDSVYRLGAAVLGLVVGTVFARHDRRRPWHRSSYGEARTLIAAIVAVTGIGPLIVLLTGRGIGPLSPLVQGLRGAGVDALLARCGSELSDRCAVGIVGGVGPLLMSLVPLVLTVVSAVGLRAGRRAALLLAVAVNVVLAALAAISIGTDDLRHPAELAAIDRAFPGFAFVAILVPLAVCALLVVTRRRFAVRAARGSGRRLAFVTVAALIVLVVAEIALVASEGVGGAASVLDALRRFIPAGFVHSHIGTHLDGVARIARLTVGPVFWAVFTAGMLRLLRTPADVPDSVDDDRYRTLLRVHGDTLGFLGTWQGNRHWFTDDGRGGIAYRLVSGLAISVGDPVGEDADAVVRGFVDFCDRQGWSPVLYSVHDDTLQRAAALGWAHMPVAEETVVPLERFSLDGRAWAKVRQPYRRADRDGLHAEWTRWADLAPGMSVQLDELSEQWIAEKALPEMGFTLGGIDELKDREVALMLAIGPQGELQAVTSWLPVHERGELIGWTLDFMRRADGAMPGVMEFLLASAALRMKADGLRLMSLSGAPLAQTMEADAGDDSRAMLRLLTWLGGVLEPAYGFRSLLSFKAKFNPDRRPLHMVYPDPAQLPAIGLVLARAYLPDVTTSEYLALARTLRSR
jgi:lysylphosphatidylglycerol synthetase-like protein (DUF2156 family)